MMGNGSVIVQTWGTNSKSHFGVRRLAATQYRAENVGHASIELRLPVNEENTQLINKYCQVQAGTKIPCVTKFELNNDGTYESVYVVRFSFIPSNNGRLFHLNPTYTDDTNYERAGHHTTERHYLETADLVARRAHKRVINLFPSCSLTEHGRALDFSSAKGKYILNKKAIANCEDLLDTAELIKNKIAGLEGNPSEIDLKHPKNKTIFLAAKRLGLELPKENKILVDQLLSQLSVFKENTTKEIKELVNKLIPLKDMVENKEENTKCRLRLAEITKIQNSLPKISSFEDFAAWYSDNPNTSKEIKEKIDALYPGVAENNFDNFIANLRDELSKLYEFYRTIISKNDSEATLFYQNEDKYLCYGRPADSQVRLPIGSGQFELNAACMLEQMRKIVDSGFEYDLHTHNCSSTALSILKAGREGKVKEVSPAKVFATVTPQIVYNTAAAFRDNACGISASQSLINLDIFYIDRSQNHPLTVKSRKCANVHDAIVRFAVDNIFPEESDERDNVFYIFSKETKKAILKEASKPIPTELLRDLWGIIPDRTLPLSTSTSHIAVIDQNMTMRQLIQGLTVLAQIKAEERLQHTCNLNSEIIREEIITDKKINTQPKLFLMGLFAAAGLAIGVGIGVALVSTGVFAPFGVGVLGAVAVAATLGGGLALISGALGFGAAKLTGSPTNIQTGGTIVSPTTDDSSLRSLKLLAQLKSSSSEQPAMSNTNSPSSENCPNNPLLRPDNVCDISFQDQTEENDMDLILSETANLRP
ncbi:protein SidG [Legionella sainthelensi]|uniref:Protein SidG n=1 Tax=Legionella sainthelensi TaxID=28087 RepID=A0A0W0YH12_9GAMM|nr:hypothetical protein [Legionella sainthelensi]KTD56250.1 protein SidG [Legionella sainthelensi]VEH31897.1 protein SidG [Legionella sainthelensi]